MSRKPDTSKNSFFPTSHSHEEDNNWQLSYLDIITLLVAFLIVILALTHIGTIPTVSDLFKTAGDTELILTPIEEIKSELEGHLKDDIQKERISVVRDLNDLRITFSSTKLYRSGEAVLLPDARPLLDNVLEALQLTYRYDFNIEVEGHTDNAPIVESPFPSNWELSTARAANVVKYFTEMGYDESRLKASGYAYSRPLLPNNDSYGNPIPENMEKNRRIVLRVYHDADQIKQPVQNRVADTSELSESDCNYSLQAGVYNSLHNAIRVAGLAESVTGLDFQLTHMNSLFSVRTTDLQTLADAIDMYPLLSRQLENDGISIIHSCEQDPAWLHYHIQLGLFGRQNNALNFISHLKSRYNIEAQITQDIRSNYRVITGPFKDYQSANRRLTDIKQIDQLSDSFLAYNTDKTRDVSINYLLQLASFPTESDALQFADIVSAELNITPEIQAVEKTTGKVYVVFAAAGEWEQTIELRDMFMDFGSSRPIIHQTESFNSKRIQI